MHKNTELQVEYFRRADESRRYLRGLALALFAMFALTFVSAAILNYRWAQPTICQPHVTHGGQWHCEAN